MNWGQWRENRMDKSTQWLWLVLRLHGLMNCWDPFFIFLISRQKWVISPLTSLLLTDCVPIRILTVLPSPSGVPDRYHLRPDLGGHPSALQQQQHQHAHFNPQQVWKCCHYCTRQEASVYIHTQSLLYLNASLLFFHYNNCCFAFLIREYFVIFLILGKRPEINGTNWLICFIFLP